MFIDTIHNLKASTLTTEQFEECKGTASQGRAEPAALKSRSAAQDILARASPGLSKELSAALVPGHAPQASCDHMSHYKRICNAIERRSAIARVILPSHTPPSRQIVFTSDAKPHVNLSTEGSLSHCHPTEFLQMFSAGNDKGAYGSRTAETTHRDGNPGSVHATYSHRGRINQDCDSTVALEQDFGPRVAGHCSFFCWLQSHAA